MSPGGVLYEVRTHPAVARAIEVPPSGFAKMSFRRNPNPRSRTIYTQVFFPFQQNKEENTFLTPQELLCKNSPALRHMLR